MAYPTVYDSLILAESSVKLYYPLNETAGTTITDKKNGINGTYNGGFTLNSGAPTSFLDNSVAMSGTNSCETGSNSNFHPTTAITAECWFKLASLPSAYMHFIGCGYSANSNPYVDWDLLIDPTNNVEFLLGKTAGVIYTNVVGAIPSTNVWHHLVGTWDGTTMTLYMDGVSQGTASLASPILNSGGPLCFGHYTRGGTHGEYLAGSISSAAIYNASLPASSVVAHYNYGKIGILGGPPILCGTNLQGNYCMRGNGNG